MKIYLRWYSMPMGALENYKDWYYPYLGEGLSMMVLVTQTGRFQAFYIGKSTDVGRRWYQHLNDWFLNPGEEFLKDPVKVFKRQPK